VLFFVGLGKAISWRCCPKDVLGHDGFVLLAVPFFILAGNLMNTGGITSRIFRFAKALFATSPAGWARSGRQLDDLLGMSGSPWPTPRA